MASIQKNGDVWHLRYRVNGKNKGHSLKTKSKREALKKLKEWEEEQAAYAAMERFNLGFNDGIVQSNPELGFQQERELEENLRAQAVAYEQYRHLSLDDLWTKWSTWAEKNRARNTVIGYQTAWNKWALVPHVTDVTHVTKANIEELVRILSEEKKISASGITQYLINFQGIFATAIAEGWIAMQNPFQLGWLEAKQTRIKPFLNEVEREEVLQKAIEIGDPNTILFVAIAGWAGLRKDEVANLMWHEIDFNRKVITIQAHDADPAKGIEEFTIKGKRLRVIPIATRLMEILQEHRQERGYVISIPAKDTAKVREGRFRFKLNMPQSFYRVVEAFPEYHLTPHLLRHSFASILVGKGISIFKVSKWLGHASVSITENVYAHLAPLHDEDIG